MVRQQLDQYIVNKSIQNRSVNNCVFTIAKEEKKREGDGLPFHSFDSKMAKALDIQSTFLRLKKLSMFLCEASWRELPTPPPVRFRFVR